MVPEFEASHKNYVKNPKNGRIQLSKTGLRRQTPFGLALTDPHVVHEHLLWEYGCGIGIARPGSADGDIQ